MRTGNLLLLVDRQREPATRFYLSTGREDDSDEGHTQDSSPVSRDRTCQILRVWFLLLDKEPISGSQFSSFFFASERLNFNEKYRNINYSAENACGLAIFFKFSLHWLFSNLPFFERDPHMDSPEAIWIKPQYLLSTIDDVDLFLLL